MNFLLGLIIGILSMAFYCGCLQIEHPQNQNQDIQQERYYHQ